jgi:CubicO group peptidase (beta-lactamase class C family)
MRLKIITILALMLLPMISQAQGQQYLQVNDIPYTASDDAYAQERCKLDVYYPTELHDAPVVVWFHGGGIESGNKHIDSQLKNSGLVVVAANYRLLPNAKIDDILDDAAAAVAWTYKNIEKYGGSHCKIFVAGHSAGGYLLDMIGLDKRWLAKYGVDADSLAGLIPFSGQCITHYNIRKQQGIPPLQATIDQYAPLTYVRPDAPPIVIISGDRELELYGRYEEQAYFWRMLKLVGHKDVTLYEMQGYDHGNMPQPAYYILKQHIKRLTAKVKAKESGLPRSETPTNVAQAMDSFFQGAANEKNDIHSVMIVKGGNVIYSRWQSKGEENTPHVLHSVSKTFTATAVGLAIAEGKMALTDKVIDYFPDKLPANVSKNLKSMTVRDLLTMSCGHDVEPSIRNAQQDWVTAFLAHPVVHKPGKFYLYNSMGTYMLSAIVQKVTGEKVADYLDTRLFQPLRIDKPRWDESPQGINCGGWGLYLKTEDLAKMGQLLLQKGKWNGKQLIPAKWVTEMSKKQVESINPGTRIEQAAERGMTKETSDWMQGYGYQMWRCRPGCFRADGARGQYIIVVPDKDAVIAITSDVEDLQGELNLVWKYILPAL